MAAKSVPSKGIHSTAQVDIAYAKTEPPEILYLGTARRFAKAIE
ncbi:MULTISPECIES: hypothetical protein [unclassified Eikenella]|nr:MULTISPECIES: hypothetical protein [unclassified Eikenella]